MSQSNYVAPSSGFAILNDTGQTLEIEIPPARPWSNFLFLSFWLLGWAVGEIAVGRVILNSLIAFTTDSIGNVSGPFAVFGGLFTLVWFSGWTVVGFFAIRAWLWMMFGQEIIIVHSDRLEISRGTIGKAENNIYHADRVGDLHVIYGNPSGSMNQIGNLSRRDMGALAFGYGTDLVRFGSSVSDEEADLILGRIKEKMQRLRSSRAQSAQQS